MLLNKQLMTGGESWVQRDSCLQLRIRVYSIYSSKTAVDFFDTLGQVLRGNVIIALFPGFYSNIVDRIVVGIFLE